MIKDKKISVIIPVYNAERYVGKCIESVLGQNYSNLEVIVVNDGSSDNSAEKIKPYLSRIVYIEQKNAGGSAARNAGLRVATGEYVFFLDADDLLLNGSLKKMVVSIEEEDADICIGGYTEIDENGKKTKDVCAFSQKEYYSQEAMPILYTIYPNPSTKLFRMSIIRGNNLSFAKLPIAQDLNFYFKYLLCSKNAIGINDQIYAYRMTNGSISRTYDDRVLGIIDAFEDVRKFAADKNLAKFYDQHLQNVELMHLAFQMYKLRYMKRGEKRVVFSGIRSAISKIHANRKSPTYRKARRYIRNLHLYLVLYIIKGKLEWLRGSN